MPKPVVVVTDIPGGWEAFCLSCSGIMYGDPLVLGEFPTKQEAQDARKSHLKDHKPLPCPTCGHMQPAKIEEVGDYLGVER